MSSRIFSLFNVLALFLLLASVLVLQQVKKPAPTPPMPVLEMAELHPVKLTVYYSDSKLQNLRPIEQSVEVTSDSMSALAQAAANAWAKGSPESSALSVAPAGSAAPHIYVRGLHFYADFPESYLKLNYSSSGERILLCSLVRTLLEKRGQDVTFLVGGANVPTLGHLDLSDPYTRQDCQDT